MRDKIEESACSIVCLQETKKEHFDMAFVRKFAPKRFDHFDCVPSVGASGGLLIVSNSSCFVGQVIDKQRFGMTVHFSSVHSSDTWYLTNVYGPCVEPARSEFISWFRSHQFSDDDNWIFMGDFLLSISRKLQQTRRLSC